MWARGRRIGAVEVAIANILSDEDIAAMELLAMLGICVSGWGDVDLDDVLTLKKLKVALELAQDPCSKLVSGCLMFRASKCMMQVAKSLSKDPCGFLWGFMGWILFSPRLDGQNNPHHHSPIGNETRLDAQSTLVLSRAKDLSIFQVRRIIR